MANATFKVILPRVANVPRNYIIDQTNVYKNARKCKLRPFSDYQKVAVYLFVCWSFEDEFTIELVNIICCQLQIAVVVFPKPEELKRRYEKGSKEMGKEVPTASLSEMIGIFSIYLLSAGV